MKPHFNKIIISTQQKVQSGFLRQEGSLTLSLDFKDAYGILRVERSDFTRGKRVSPLDTGRN